MPHDSTEPITAAIVGPGNIGTDLLIKLQRSAAIDVRHVVGVVESDSLARARGFGVDASAEGVDWLLRQDPLPRLVFEATSAKAHIANAPRYAEAGIQAVDLTPAHLGSMVSPPVNGSAHLDAPNVSMIIYGGQATIPGSGPTSTSSPRPPRAPSRRSAGRRTARRSLSSTRSSPPMITRDTVFCAIDTDADRDAITASVLEMVAEVQQYVPGYTLRAEPQFDEAPGPVGRQRPGRGLLEVKGSADYLPAYAGNLDIMTARPLGSAS